MSCLFCLFVWLALLQCYILFLDAYLDYMEGILLLVGLFSHLPIFVVSLLPNLCKLVMVHVFWVNGQGSRWSQGSGFGFLSSLHPLTSHSLPRVSDSFLDFDLMESLWLAAKTIMHNFNTRNTWFWGPKCLKAIANIGYLAQRFLLAKEMAPSIHVLKFAPKNP